MPIYWYIDRVQETGEKKGPKATNKHGDSSESPFFWGRRSRAHLVRRTRRGRSLQFLRFGAHVRKAFIRLSPASLTQNITAKRVLSSSLSPQCPDPLAVCVPADKNHESPEKREGDKRRPRSWGRRERNKVTAGKSHERYGDIKNAVL